MFYVSVTHEISGPNLAEKIMTYLEALGLGLSNIHG